MRRVGLAHAFADVVDAPNPVRVSEQLLEAFTAFVFDDACLRLWSALDRGVATVTASRL
jgi:hypothetical protein